jgi:hypothetical protein
MQGNAGWSGLVVFGLAALCAAGCSFDSAPIKPGSGVAGVSPPAMTDGHSGEGGASAGTGANAGNGGSAGSESDPAGRGGSSGGVGGIGSAGKGGTGGTGMNAGSGGSAGSGGTGGTSDGGTGGSAGSGALEGCANPLREGTLCNDGLFCTFGERCHNGTCSGGAPTNCSALADSCNTGECDETSNSCQRVPARENMTCSDTLFCTTGETCHSGVCGGGVARDCSDAVTLPCHVPACDENADTCTQQPGRQGQGCDDGFDCTNDEVCDNGECTGTSCNNTCQPGFDCVIDCHGVEQCDSTCDQSGGCAVSCAGSDQCTFNCKGAQCGLNCSGTSLCNVRCSANATCAIDCRGAAPDACSAIDCGGSTCTLTCDPGDSCGFKDCKDQMTCSDGTIACGHGCPMGPP